MVTRVEKNRFWELEGLRGIAAVMVVLQHYLLAFYSLAFFGKESGYASIQNMRFEDNLYGNPLSVLASGSFAVSIFFVLSGFVLSIGFFQTGKLDIIKKLAAKRYLRLMLPALASVLLALILIVCGLSYAYEAGSITGSSWLMSAWNVPPDFFGAVKSGVFDIFTKSSGDYNSVLWTMTYEFLGSFLVFGFLALFSKSKFRPLLYIFLLIATFNTWFIAFVIGMIFADMYAKGLMKQKKRSMLLVVPLVLSALFLGGYPLYGVAGTVYQNIGFSGLGINWQLISVITGASLAVGLVLSVSQIARIFANKYISKLGKYTFSLYLTHLLVLYTFTSGVFILLDRQLGVGFNKSALISIVLSIPVMWLVTFLFEKYVDSNSMKVSSYVGGMILGTTKTPKLNKFLKKVSKRMKRLLRKKVVNNV